MMHGTTIIKFPTGSFDLGKKNVLQHVTCKTAYIIIVYLSAPLGTQGTCDTPSLTQLPAKILINLTACFASFYCFLQNGSFPGFLGLPRLQAPNGIQSNACFPMDSSPFLEV